MWTSTATVASQKVIKTDALYIKGVEAVFYIDLIPFHSLKALEKARCSKNLSNNVISVTDNIV